MIRFDSEFGKPVAVGRLSANGGRLSKRVLVIAIISILHCIPIQGATKMWHIGPGFLKPPIQLESSPRQSFAMHIDRTIRCGVLQTLESRFSRVCSIAFCPMPYIKPCQIPNDYHLRHNETYLWRDCPSWMLFGRLPLWYDICSTTIMIMLHNQPRHYPMAGLYSGIFVMYLQCHASKKGADKGSNIVFYALCLQYALFVPLFALELIIMMTPIVSMNNEYLIYVFVDELCRTSSI